MKTKFAYHDVNFQDDSLCRNRSSKSIICKDEELKQVIQTIENLEPEKTSQKVNLIPEERRSLQELQNDDRVVIKETDKGGALVIMNRDFYDNKLVGDHLNDTSTYTNVAENDDNITAKQLNELVNKHEKFLTYNEKEYITKYDWTTGEFYIRPKIHKCKTVLDEIKRAPSKIIEINGAPDLVGRPIIAGTHSPTRHLSDVIAKILTPLVQMQTTYVKDNWDYLRKLPHRLEEKCKLFGCDMTSLYTSIPHELGLKAIKYWINRCRNPIPARFTNNFIIESVEFLLKNNNCTFKDQLFNQINGTAMDASFASFYACLTIEYLEETVLFPKLSNIYADHNVLTVKETCKRFMSDDIVFLPRHLCKNDFLSLLSSMDNAIKFTLEDSETISLNSRNIERINFLDISIILDENGVISTDIYYKPTNSHDYLHYDSFHPKHTLENIPYCLAKGIIVFVSDSEVMEYRLSELKELLTQCEYPQKIIEKGIHNARLQGPFQNKTADNKIITYIHPNMSNFTFKHIINTTSSLLQNTKSDRIRNIFKNIRFVEGISEPKNILRTITSTNLKNTNKENVVDSNKPGIYAECKEPRCYICNFKYIENCTSFITSNNTKWEIRSHINCNSKNVICYLECNMCNGQVTKTGKTEMKLRARINNHIE